MKKSPGLKNLRFLFVFAAIFCATAGFFVYESSNALQPSIARAQTTTTYSLKGWAWSEVLANTSSENSPTTPNDGWISFSCQNENPGCDPAGTAAGDYGVIENSVNGTGILSGYAWTGNGASGPNNTGIGWINFSPPDYTGSGCTGNCAAQINLSTGYVTGWAVACAALADKTGCDPAGGLDSTGGGWDGWIHLDPNGVGPKKNANCTISGYSWGGENIGWIQWNPNNGGVPEGGVTGGLGCNQVTVSLAADRTSFSAPDPTDNVTLTWATTNASYCDNIRATNSITGTLPDVSTNGATNGSSIPTHVDLGETTFLLSCSGPTGSNTSMPIHVFVAGSPPPSAAVLLTPSPSTVRQGSSSNLEWVIVGSNISASSCSITGPDGVTLEDNLPSDSGSVSSGSINQTSTFTLTCGSHSSSATIDTVSSPIER